MNRAPTSHLVHALLAGVAALAPAMAASQPADRMQAERPAFVAPEGSFILTRTLERGLPDGARILTRRRYEVRFAVEPGGFRIDGKLLSAEVEAPQSLSFLADLERTRPDTGLFPMQLDAAGTLLERAPAAGPDSKVQQAAGHVGKVLAGLSLPRTEARDAASFVELLARKGMQTQWPADLFRPIAGSRTQTLPVPLPGGETGSVRVDLDASAGRNGLLNAFRRTIVTRLGDSERQTDEIWTLEPMR